MNAVFYLQINCFCIILLIIMLFNVAPPNSNRNSIDQKLFQLLILSTIVTLIFDTSMWYFDGTTFPFSVQVNYISTLGYLVANPFVCFFWVLYGDYKLNTDIKILKKHIIVYLIPCIIVIFCAFVSIKTKWMFYIDENNRYHRGTLLIMIFSASLYFVMIYFLIIRKSMHPKTKSKFLTREACYYFFLSSLPTIIGTLIQSMFYGISTIWVGVTVSIFIIFINIQNNQIYVDHLTRVYNRRYIQNHLANISKLVDKDKKAFALMIDIDDFKAINDTYGHSMGDSALIAIADILKAVCKKKYSIARFGGDEFLIWGLSENNCDVELLVLQINRALETYNTIGNFDFELSISIGSEIYDKTIDKDGYAFLSRVDQEMYKEKFVKNRL